MKDFITLPITQCRMGLFELLLVLLCCQHISTKNTVVIVKRRLNIYPSYLLETINSEPLFYRHNRTFAAKGPSTPYTEQVDVLSLFKKFLDIKSSCRFAPVPDTINGTVEFALPKDKSIPDYLTYAFSKPTSLREDMLQEQLLHTLLNHTDAFIRDSGTYLKRTMTISYLDLERLVYENFKVTRKCQLIQSNEMAVSLPKHIEASAIHRIFRSYRDDVDINLQVYIPDDKTVEELVATAAGQVFETARQAFAAFYVNVMNALCFCHQPNTIQIAFSFIYSEMNRYCFFRKAPGIKLYDKATADSVRISLDFHSHMLYNLSHSICNKFYVEFDNFPVNSSSSQDNDELLNLCSFIGNVFIFCDIADVVRRIVCRERRLDYLPKYEASFINPQDVQTVVIPMDVLNVEIAKILNSKLAISLSPTEIPAPNTDAFKQINNPDGSCRYECAAFPFPKYYPILGRDQILKYFRFAKGKFVQMQERDRVIEDFFKIFWSAKTLGEFEAFIGAPSTAIAELETDDKSSSDGFVTALTHVSEDYSDMKSDFDSTTGRIDKPSIPLKKSKVKTKLKLYGGLKANKLTKKTAPKELPKKRAPKELPASSFAPLASKPTKKAPKKGKYHKQSVPKKLKRFKSRRKQKQKQQQKKTTTEDISQVSSLPAQSARLPSGGKAAMHVNMRALPRYKAPYVKLRLFAIGLGISAFFVVPLIVFVAWKHLRSTDKQEAKKEKETPVQEGHQAVY